MKKADNWVGNSAELLAGTEAFDLYLMALSSSLKSMALQLQTLKSAIADAEKAKRRAEQIIG